MQVVICKIKDWLKPLVSILIPGRYRRRWVGDPGNGQALWDICKYQVQTGLDTGSPLVESNFAFGMLFNKQAHSIIKLLYILTQLTNLITNLIASQPKIHFQKLKY